MRVLMLIPYINARGPILSISNLLLKSLNSQGLSVVTEQWGRHGDNESLWEKIFGRFKDILRIRNTLKNDYDILFVMSAHGWNALIRDIFLTGLTYEKGRCTAVMLHGSLSQKLVAPGNHLFKLATVLLLRLCDCIMVLSQEEKKQWSQFYPHGKFYVVTNPFLPMPTKMTRTSPSSELPQLLFAGRIIETKGIFDILRAMPQIVKHIPCHLHIAGDGPQLQQVRALIKELRLSGYVTVKGYLNAEQMAKLYEEADIFVLPTYHDEGFPTVISEAMQAGLPIVTTNIRGTADHLEDCVNALFVPPRDPLALANILIQLLSDSRLRDQMGKANKAKVKNFSPDVVVHQYIRIMREVIEKKKKCTYI